MVRNVLTAAAAVAVSCCLMFAWSLFFDHGGVAVVDLDEIAHRLGRDAEMQQAFQGQTDRMQQALAAIQQKAVSQLEDARKHLGETPTQEEATSFLKLRQSAQVQLNQIKQQAEQKLGQHRQQLVNQFRDDAKPVAAKIARQRGFTTVVTKNDSFVFAFEEAVDITDEVAQAMLAARPAPAQPATPAQAVPASTQPAAAPAVQQVGHEEPAVK
jgi:Skp family chaperone for outer membrane proteins